MKAYRTLFFALLIALLTALLLIACSGSDDSDDDENSTPPTISSGHEFLLMKEQIYITVGTSEFVAKNESGDARFWGTAASMSNLFSKFTVTYSKEDDPSKGDILYGLPINDAIMLLLPKENIVTGEPVAFKDTSVALATGGSCPSAAVNYLAVLGPDSSHNRADMTYGKAQTNAASNYSLQGDLDALPTAYASGGYTPLQTFTGFNCSSGRATNNAEDKMFFTPSGMALAQTQDTDNTYTLLPTSSIPTQTEIVANGIKFRGWSEIIIASENYVYPMAFTGDGVDLDGGTYDDFEGNTISATGINVTIGASGANAALGIYDTSRLKHGNLPGNFRVTATNLPDGRIALVGTADSDNDDNTIVDDGAKDWTYIILVEMP